MVDLVCLDLLGHLVTEDLLETFHKLLDPQEIQVQRVKLEILLYLVKMEPRESKELLENKVHLV